MAQVYTLNKTLLTYFFIYSSQHVWEFNDDNNFMSVA